MFAIVRTGGKQYRVAAGDKIVVDRMDGEAGSRVALGDVLFTSEGSAKGLTVAAEIIAQAKADKIIVFKKKRRHNYRRRNGHRQQHTILKIISVGGEAPPKAAAKAAKPAKADEAPGAPAVDASNLSLISGVGPAIEKKLRAAGITSWNDIAAWSADDIAKWDVELKLSGRATKEEWVDQAKELLAGKAPRAKVDQAEKASGKDK